MKSLRCVLWICWLCTVVPVARAQRVQHMQSPRLGVHDYLPMQPIRCTGFIKDNSLGASSTAVCHAFVQKINQLGIMEQGLRCGSHTGYYIYHKWYGSDCDRDIAKLNAALGTQLQCNMDNMNGGLIVATSCAFDIALLLSAVTEYETNALGHSTTSLGNTAPLYLDEDKFPVGTVTCRIVFGIRKLWYHNWKASEVMLLTTVDHKVQGFHIAVGRGSSQDEKQSCLTAEDDNSKCKIWIMPENNHQSCIDATQGTVYDAERFHHPTCNAGDEFCPKGCHRNTYDGVYSVGDFVGECCESDDADDDSVYLTAIAYPIRTASCEYVVESSSTYSGNWIATGRASSRDVNHSCLTGGRDSDRCRVWNSLKECHNDTKDIRFNPELFHLCSDEASRQPNSWCHRGLTAKYANCFYNFNKDSSTYGQWYIAAVHNNAEVYCFNDIVDKMSGDAECIGYDTFDACQGAAEKVQANFEYDGVDRIQRKLPSCDESASMPCYEGFCGDDKTNYCYNEGENAVLLRLGDVGFIRDRLNIDPLRDYIPAGSHRTQLTSS